MSIVNPGLQLQGGVQPVNPRPVDTWSGPFYGSTVLAASAQALSSIPLAVRFPSMEVRLIAGGQSYKYWFRNGITDSDLIEIAIAGATGLSGSTGPVGATGATGPIGATGASGIQGLQGATGASGIQGLPGATGASGIQGLQGATGASGVQGLQGATGASGIQGNVGATGASGIQGLQGATGASGIQGLPGATGASGIQGLQGATGASGIQGLPGATGASGIQGNVGATGASGIQGDVGATGASGIQGLQGATGASGIQGLPGSTGASGIQGLQGATGASGIQGLQGATGASGVQGATGASGIQGLQGATGASGLAGATGATGPTGPAGATGPDFVYSQDLFVSLPGSKTFGRYVNGDIIRATGKTPAQVIEMAIVEAINPAVNFSPTPTNINFNQTSISNTLNFSYTILSLNAQVSAGILEFKRANQSVWTTLSTNVSSNPGVFVHTFTDTQFNTNALNYRYTLADTSGGLTVDTKNVNIIPYSAPTGTITLSGNVRTPETNILRETGNIQTIISGSINRNSPNVSITAFRIQSSVNLGSWTTIFTNTTIGPGNYTVPNYFDNPTGSSLATSIRYRFLVDDIFQANTEIFNSTNNLINFRNLIFYGPSSSAPTNSSQVRALTGRGFAPIGGTGNLANPFILNTSKVFTNFTAAMPTSLSISLVQDEQVSFADVTSQYINNPFNVNDAFGNATPYKVYTMTIAGPYSEDHRHIITRI